ncbi:PaaI family thioesterase [Chloroflexota bacterium]
MQLQPNSRNCFVCGLENEYGLHLRFYETVDGEVIVETTVPDHFQGYPGIVHGGIVASLVDEALGRVHMGSADNPRFMFTAKISVSYRKPVPTQEPLRIVAQALKNKRRTATSVCSIYGPDNELLVEANAVLINVPDEMLANADLETLGWKVYPESGI